MTNSNYTEDEINWALEELRKKGVKDPTREHAIKLLDTFKEFGSMVVGEIDKDKKSGKLKSKIDEKQLN
jgi:hypothetical protein